MKTLVAAISLFMAGCVSPEFIEREEGYDIQVPAYAPLPEPALSLSNGYHAGYIMPPLGGGRPVGGYGYSGYGDNVMVTGPVGGPVGSTMVSGY